MQLITTIDIKKSKFEIKPEHKIMFLGSCFADNVGEQFVRGGFDAMVNPFGTLYNPMSIAYVLECCMNEKVYDTSSPEVFHSSDGIWHSWMHHSRFSAATQDELINNINSRMQEASAFLRSADVLVITLGTSIIYYLKENGMLVANCHKQPDSLFIREHLTVKRIVNKWADIVDKLQILNDKLKIIFTVSPIRHKRDGMHINNISKGILLQSVDEIVDKWNTKQSHVFHNDILATFELEKGLKRLKGEYFDITYFPSYEIMLDELRDYRFYADDLIHPSPLAVEYIWQRFKDTYMTSDTQEYIRLKNKEWARNQHRTIIMPK